MIPIQALLNKIKWDKQENPEEVILYYYDRIKDTILPLPYLAIKGVENGFLIVTQQGRETHIPLHRIRRVEKKGKFIWERKGLAV